MSTLHHLEYLNTVHTQQVFVLLVLLASASSCVHTMLRVSTVLLSADAYTVISSCSVLNPLTPNDHYIGRTAQLTSRRCILYIYSTNKRTEYFKHAA
jgi:hypothetical protein